MSAITTQGVVNRVYSLAQELLFSSCAAGCKGKEKVPAEKSPSSPHPEPSPSPEKAPAELNITIKDHDDYWLSPQEIKQKLSPEGLDKWVWENILVPRVSIEKLLPASGKRGQTLIVKIIGNMELIYYPKPKTFADGFKVGIGKIKVEAKGFVPEEKIKVELLPPKIDSSGKTNELKVKVIIGKEVNPDLYLLWIEAKNMIAVGYPFEVR